MPFANSIVWLWPSGSHVGWKPWVPVSKFHAKSPCL